MPFVESIRRVRTGCTLVVVPPSLVTQWQAEARKHAPSLVVYVYRGLASNRNEVWSASAHPFLCSDIVLTTYQVLAKDLRLHGPLVHSPALHMSWWRVVLDESQLVASGTSYY